jgi:hypothetical protein
LKELKASVILPMHIFGPETLAAFVDEARKSFKITYMDTRTITVSPKTLPTEPTVMVLPGY